ncbi:MAG: glycosyltransferase family 4 protein [Victivallales bacterium]|jgi:glycosyltransferase involved in cell wall biosynthesis|nr:glycosyltransferase family 4 protein [Victivallales bacterium]
MKICHIITRMIVGGAQENTLYTILGHLQKGHEVTLITGPSPGREGELLQNVDFPPFETIVLPSLVRELDPLNDIKAYFTLKKLLRERKFDVVHTHSSKAGVIGRVAARKAGIPVVVHTVHGQAFHPYEKGWRNTIYKESERFAARYCDKIFAVAQAMIDQCVDASIAPAEKYMVVYSGMDTSAFAHATRDLNLRQKLEIPPNARVIATLARLFPMKGYEYAIPAAAKLIADYPDTHVLIIGDGPMRDELDKQIAALNLTGHFHFAGLVPPAQVHEFLAQADLLWHLSLREGLPRSVVQALATGIPAIGYRLDGTPEVVIDGETGFCVAPESIDEVVAATQKLWNAPTLAREMGKNGQKLVLERFDWRRMADILEKEYLEATYKNRKFG